MTIVAVTKPHVDVGAGEYSNIPTAELLVSGVALTASIPPITSVLSDNAGRLVGILAAVTHAGDSLVSIQVAAHALQATVAANDTSYILPHRGEAVGLLTAITKVGSGSYIELALEAQPLEASTTEHASSEVSTDTLTVAANALTAVLTEHLTSDLITDALSVGASNLTAEVSEVGPAESVVPTANIQLTTHALSAEATGEVIPLPGARPWRPVTQSKPRKVSVTSKQKTLKLSIEAHAPSCSVTFNAESLIPSAQIKFTRLEPEVLIDYDDDRALDELQALMAVIQWTENRDALL